MKRSVLVITVDEMYTVDVQYDDPICAGVAVLGGLELAKTVVLDKLKTHMTKTSGKGEQKPQEETVGKEEMLGILLKTRKKLEQRIDAVHKSDGEQSFIVNKSLFDEI